jgi:Flp pilus assembly pilin Flp
VDHPLQRVFRLSPWLERESREEGQGLTEYALILTFIAIVAIVALVFLGGSVSTVLSGNASAINSV